MRGATAPRPSRRLFLTGAASTVVLFLAGCGRSDGRSATATPTTDVDRDAAPVMPELGAMEPQFVEDARRAGPRRLVA